MAEWKGETWTGGAEHFRKDEWRNNAWKGATEHYHETGSVESWNGSRQHSYENVSPQWQWETGWAET